MATVTLELPDALYEHLRVMAERAGMTIEALIVKLIDEWLTAVENDPRFLKRIEEARASLRAGRGVRLEDIPEE